MQVVTFCMNILWEHASSWLDLRVTALQKRNGVFTVSSPMCCCQAKVETKDGSRDVNKFVYKPTKWMANSKALTQALGKRCSNSNGPPFHRHIMLNGGLAIMVLTYAPEVVNTVLRGLRGITVLPIRWVVTNKGDPDRPEVRCRLVGRELRSRTKGTLLAHELFSAMPPWEIFKVLLGLLVSDNALGAEGERA